MTANHHPDATILAFAASGCRPARTTPRLPCSPLRRYRGTADYRVLDAALAIEPRFDEVLHWYRHTPLLRLENRTAAELVDDGRRNELIAYLHTIEP